MCLCATVPHHVNTGYVYDSKLIATVLAVRLIFLVVLCCVFSRRGEGPGAEAARQLWVFFTKQEKVREIFISNIFQTAVSQSTRQPRLVKLWEPFVTRDACCQRFFKFLNVNCW